MPHCPSLTLDLYRNPNAQASRTMRDRQRMGEIEHRLNDIERETTTLKSRIRQTAQGYEDTWTR